MTDNDNGDDDENRSVLAFHSCAGFSDWWEKTAVQQTNDDRSSQRTEPCE